MSAKTNTNTVDVEQRDTRDEEIFEQVPVRAYEIYDSGAGGDELENWLEAEKQLNAERRSR
jgi:hypothetical protein